MPHRKGQEVPGRSLGHRRGRWTHTSRSGPPGPAIREPAVREPAAQAVVRLRGWLEGVGLLTYYQDPVKRALLKPEAIFEVETGLKLSAYDVTAASVTRTEWYQVVRRFFERYDFLILPTAQVFPFSADIHWPDVIAGKRMETYHEWMKGTLLVTMSGCPSLAVPAGFNAQGLPIGIQIIGPNRRELDCLSLGYVYEAATNWTHARLPPPLTESNGLRPV